MTKRTPAIKNSIRQYNDLLAKLQVMLQQLQKTYPLPSALPEEISKLKTSHRDDLMQDVALTTRPEEDQPTWLTSESVRAGIRAMHVRDRSREEMQRLDMEERNLFHWVHEESRVVRSLLNLPERTFSSRLPLSLLFIMALVDALYGPWLRLRLGHLGDMASGCREGKISLEQWRDAIGPFEYAPLEQVQVPRVQRNGQAVECKPDARLRTPAAPRLQQYNPDSRHDPYSGMLRMSATPLLQQRGPDLGHNLYAGMLRMSATPQLQHHDHNHDHDHDHDPERNLATAPHPVRYHQCDHEIGTEITSDDEISDDECASDLDRDEHDGHNALGLLQDLYDSETLGLSHGTGILATVEQLRRVRMFMIYSQNVILTLYSPSIWTLS